MSAWEIAYLGFLGLVVVSMFPLGLAILGVAVSAPAAALRDEIKSPCEE